MSKIKLEVVKGIKFSFTTVKTNGSKIVGLAMESDLEVSYKNVDTGDGLVTIRGIGKVENVCSFIEKSEQIVGVDQDRLDFIQSFKYKKVDYSQPIIPVFSEKVETKKGE